MEALNTLSTVGDRILHLLRSGGRSDRNREYEQKELVAWLNGEIKAPDGNYYNLGTSASAINRQITGDTKPNLEVLEAICDIFNVDLNWLARGKHREVTEGVEAFVSDEANRVGQIVDSVDQDIRDLILHMAQELYGINEQRKDLQTEVYTLLTDTMPGLSGDNKARASSIVRKIHSRGFALDLK